MIRLGFVGLGGMGLHQATSFAKVSGCRIVAGADVSTAAQANFLQRYPKARAYASHKELLGDNDVDAVVVVSPTFFHRQIVIDALRAGRHVLTEKPMARTVADCKAMLDVASKTGKQLMVAHCRRFDDDWGTFANLVRKGKLGRPILWRHLMAGKGPTNPWFMDDKLGGGPLIDGAVHDEDFANWLFGEPESVYATQMKLTKNTAVDTASTVVHYRSGDQLLLSWSWGVGQGSHLNDALGPKASVVFGPPANAEGLDPKTYAYYQLNPAPATGGKPQLIRSKRTDMYVNQARHFLACLNGKAKCQSDGYAALKAVAVAEAILKAAVKGGERKVRF